MKLFKVARNQLTLRLFICAFFVITTAFKVEANYLNHQLKGQSLVITTQSGQVTLTALSPDAIEALYQEQGVEQLTSYAIEKNRHSSAKVHLKQFPDRLEFSTDQITTVIEKSPLTLSYYHQGKLLLKEEQGYFDKQSPVAKTKAKVNDESKVVTDVEEAHFGFRFFLNEHEKLIGGGQRVLGMDRRGHRFPLYNKAHYGYSTESNQMYFGLPAVMSSNKYILLFDNSARGNMDLGHTENNIMQFDATGGRSAYIVFAGDNYPDLINTYVDVTGKQPLPPRWAFGNIASRFGYRTEQEVRDTVKKFKEEDFPLDALVLDLYWFGPDIKGHMGNLAWDTKAFPTPVKMMSDLNEQGVKTILITEPFILSTSSKWQDAIEHNALATDEQGNAKRFDFYFGNTGLVDVFSENGMNWFGDIYETLYKQGVAGWWGDLGEPEVHPSDSIHTLSNGKQVTGDDIHNVYGHQWAKMLFDKQIALAPKQRPFIMMRSGFAGSQRYGMIPWTGDVSRSWGGLKPQVELSLQMGLLGMGYTHSDLGGFAGGEVFDAQMYTRWLQYGVFQPVYRPHAQDNIAPEPVFHDQQTKDILREFVKLRYRLLPYNYSLAYENSTTGLPLMRPLMFEDESNFSLIDEKNSYMWGDAFLVTPVIEPDVKHVAVNVPKGVWFDYWTDKKIIGDKQVDIPVSLETIPVLVRAGSFVPMIDDIDSTQDYSSEKLTLHYYADSSVRYAEGMMYEDDGQTHNTIEKGEFEQLDFSAVHSQDKLTIVVKHFGQGYTSMPSSRDITLVVHNQQTAPKQLIINNQLQSSQQNKQQNEQQNELSSKMSWDEQAKTVTIKFTWRHQPIALELK